MTTAHYKYTAKEIETIINSMKIVIDTREKSNLHIREYLQQKGVGFINRKLSVGDYSAMIPKNVELGIMRDIYLDACLERKNSIDEITGNLQKKTKSAFENELIRSQGKPFVLVVEDEFGYKKILNGEYKSEYKPESLLGILKAYEARYGFTITYIPKRLMGNYIYYHFKAHVREFLKKNIKLDEVVELES